jgi:hypothetical protein
VSTYTEADVERWFKMAMQQAQRGADAPWGPFSMLRAGALEGLKLPGLVLQMADQADAIDAVVDALKQALPGWRPASGLHEGVVALHCQRDEARDDVATLTAERDALRAQVTEFENVLSKPENATRARWLKNARDAHARAAEWKAKWEDAEDRASLSAPPAETTPETAKRCIYCDTPTRRGSVSFGDGTEAHAKCHREQMKT